MKLQTTHSINYNLVFRIVFISILNKKYKGVKKRKFLDSLLQSKIFGG